ncbi:NAD-dependent succinate-semialdehyde dehydrogenase [Acidovorax sp. JHL-9]|uniref:NAD-dependent succinate-semialdehyde dehydrogenase n=1 Tax=Acidovorax sp. JHL-9 TaxID=1276756 RepID=UPI000401C901|nr:NAD-dependent succinate-semialdehyde dehydrogenase [Acidovorax sp. JHL-9]
MPSKPTTPVTRSINPATGHTVGEYPFDTPEQLEAALALAHDGYSAWSATPVEQRLDAIRQLGALLRRDKDSLALLATREMGKPITQARAEVEKCAVLCDWYADHGGPILAPKPTPIGADATVIHQPMGVILAVMPWNFPYWQIVRGAIPILLGGNAYFLKHAPNVMGCAGKTQALFEEAGFPAGAFLSVNLDNAQVSRVITDPSIAGVAVTGSVRAGGAIAQQAGAALKKTVLELGGSDPFIVLADADLDAAVEAAVVGRFQNSGQICVAAKRIILERPIAQEFTERFVRAVRALKMGDPERDDVYIGPMARADLRDELHQQVQESVRLGAEVLLGGQVPDHAGSYYEPTVLGAVAPGMPAFDQETFGPVAALCIADDVEHAIRLANQSEYGLSGSVWTRNRELGNRIAARVETGGFFINSYPVSDPRIPIGGIKKSGYGRELSDLGVYEFMNTRAVWFNRK